MSTESFEEPRQPDHLDEAGSVLKRAARSRTREEDLDYTVLTALNELDDWLSLPTAEDVHRATRESLAADVAHALAGYGPSLLALATSAEQLRKEANEIAAPKNLVTWPGTAAQISAAARAELAQPSAAKAAFDDLVASVQDPSTAPELIRARLNVFVSLVQLADRPVSATCSMLGEILADSADAVGVARRWLDGIPFVETLDLIEQVAGSTAADRITLCHRYLEQPAERGHHVVWVVYQNARLIRSQWRLQVGRVEFFDGPTMIEEIRQPAGPATSQSLPDELLKPAAEGGVDADFLWPTPEQLTWWVAARVDLGSGQYSDPVRVAREQADAIVELAAFRHRRSTWEPNNGHIHIVDGSERGWSGPLHNSPKTTTVRAEYDTTYDELDELRPLVAQLPVNDPLLRRLVEAIRTLNAAAKSPEPDLLTQDARVIELIAQQCGQTWQKFLKDNRAIDWAYNTVLDEVFNSVNAVLDDFVLPDRNELRRRLIQSDGHRRHILNLGAALEILPTLVDRIPLHHTSARRLRTTAYRTETPATLGKWLKELTDDFNRKVDRAARFRNGLTHGQSAQADVAQTVRWFVSHEARTSADIALEAAIERHPIKDEYDQRQSSTQTWNENITKAATVHAALFPSAHASPDDKPERDQ